MRTADQSWNDEMLSNESMRESYRLAGKIHGATVQTLIRTAFTAGWLAASEDALKDSRETLEAFKDVLKEAETHA